MSYKTSPEHLLDATDTFIWNATQTSLNNAEPQLNVLHSVSQMLPILCNADCGTIIFTPV